MAGYQGDIHVGDTIDIKFTTTSGATGAPTTLSGSPVISAYVGNSVTQITAGITLSVDFDGVTGLNNVRVVASGGNGYAAATNVSLIITTGTVGGTSAVGYEVGSFSIDCRGVNQILGTAVSTPATAGILDVNVKNIDNDAASASGTVTFPNATLASTTNITAGTITTVTTVTGLTASDVGAIKTQTDKLTFTVANVLDANTLRVGGTVQTARDIGLSVLLSSGTGTGQVKLSGGYVAPNWGDVGNPTTTVGLTNTTVGIVSLVTTLTTYTGNTVQTGDSFARIGATGSGLTSLAPSATALSTAQWSNTRAGYLDNLSVGAVAQAATALSTAQWTNTRAGYLDNLSAGAVALASGVTVTTNNDKTGYALSATGSAALTESYAADGAAATLPQLLYMTLAVLSEFSISGTTLTAKKLDGSTTAGTFTLNDASSPTAITRAT